MSVQCIVEEFPQKNDPINLESEIHKAWTDKCHELAQWTLKHVVVRPDASGQYYRAKDNKVKSCKVDQRVDASLLALHYASDRANHLIGQYTTSLDDTCKVLRLDIDLHEDNGSDTFEKNFAFSRAVVQDLKDLGFNPLLTHSNGKGGYWIDVFFDKPVPARDVRAFGAWLVLGWKEHGLSVVPEVFPKQDSIKEKYGNFFRLYGRHHKRPWYTQVWDGADWQGGNDAIDLILAHEGNSFDLVPAEVLLPPRAVQNGTVFKATKDSLPSKPDADWLKRYRGDLRTLDIAALCETKCWSVKEPGDRSFEIECPWAREHTTGDFTATIQACDPEEGLFPTFHCFHHHCDKRGIRELLDLFDAAEVDAHCAKSFGTRSSMQKSDLGSDEGPVITPDQPFKIAQMFRDLRFSNGAEATLAHYQGVWWRWIGTKYQELTEDDVRTAIYRWLNACSHFTKAKKSEEPKLLPFHPNRSIVTGVMDALKAVANVSDTIEMPCWMGQAGPGGVIAFQNGLLDLETYQRVGKAKLLPHSPRWFSINCLPHEYDEKAGCPQWLEFLDQVFEGDQERKQALAMWFGYCLTSDTRQQKFALLVGPPRSGKGVSSAIEAGQNCAVGRGQSAMPGPRTWLENLGKNPEESRQFT